MPFLKSFNQEEMVGGATRSMGLVASSLVNLCAFVSWWQKN
jgi:hypothetical protein